MMIDGLDIAGYNPYSLQVKELNGAELSSPVVATTSSEYDDRQPDWVFFDIKGAQAGNQYTVYAQQGANGTATVQVFTFDSSSSAVANNFLPSATTLTVAAGSTLDLGGVSQQVAFLSNSSPGSGGGLINSNTAVAVVLTLSPSGGSSTFSGTIGGGGGTLSLAMSGSGTQVLAGVNSYTGGTAIEAGVLSLANSAALGPSGAISFGGGTLQFSAGNTRDYASRIKNSSDSISLDTNGQTVTFDGNIDNSNTGGLTKLGYGELVLSGSNGFAGGMVVTDGTLVLADNEALADGSSLTIGDASAFTGGQGAARSDTGAVSSGLVEGVPVPSITPVPEPGTLVLLLSIVFSVRFSVFSKRLVFTEH
jgi:autotransporter-associated beta strand protein